MEENLQYVVYGAPMLLVWALYMSRRTALHKTNLEVHREATEAGLTEPASLHPLINKNRCIGCGSCVAACPEQPAHQVLGLIRRKAVLIGPTDCIGHGACKNVCPVNAITLVFGTKRRGVDIPLVKPNFETNVPGIFIAGELGGMGLIRNAVEQGRQAMESISKLPGMGSGSGLDVLIVGAGPAGFAASLGAMQQKLRYATVEQESLGGTVFQFPRGKLVMTAPVDLPLVGRVRFTETSKEKLLEFWQGVEKKTGVKINYHENVEEITRAGDGFEVKTTRDTYHPRAVLLAIGRRGTPRKLGVPGEESSKVVYRLIDPEQYQGKKVLVVGGGDSALEAATSIAEQPDTAVTLSYRSEAFSRAKQKNREKVESAQTEGRLNAVMKSNVKEIKDTSVQLEQEGKLMDIPNDAVIVSAGGILPTGFLKKIGIEVETKHGSA